jgi:hypothetical protein
MAELLRNGDFETGDLQSWRAVNASATDTLPVYSGKYKCMLWSYDGRPGYIYQRLPKVPTIPYKVSFAHRCTKCDTYGYGGSFMVGYWFDHATNVVSLDYKPKTAEGFYPVKVYLVGEKICDMNVPADYWLYLSAFVYQNMTFLYSEGQLLGKTDKMPEPRHNPVIDESFFGCYCIGHDFIVEVDALSIEELL